MNALVEWAAGGGSGLAVLGLMWKNRAGIGSFARTVITGQNELTHQSLASITESVNALKVIVDSQAAALTRQDGRIDVLEQRVTARELRIESLEAELRRTRTELDNARAQLTARDGRIAHLETQVKELEAQLATARAS